MARKKILVIEDEQDVAKLLVIRLKSFNYEVAVADSGIQGIELAHKEKPDLIILDLMLPAGDGLSVLDTLRLSSYLRFTPVIVLTGLQDEEYKKKVIEKGVDAYFQKPYDAEQLLSSIKSLIPDN
jgi:DNA-binding response OmpR family regulator